MEMSNNKIHGYWDRENRNSLQVREKKLTQHKRAEAEDISA